MPKTPATKNNWVGASVVKSFWVTASKTATKIKSNVRPINNCDNKFFLRLLGLDFGIHYIINTLVLNSQFV